MSIGEMEISINKMKKLIDEMKENPSIICIDTIARTLNPIFHIIH